MLKVSEHECTVTGFDYAAHSLAADGSEGPSGAQKVVLTMGEVEPLYTASLQSGVALNGPNCGLYHDADATSRIAGPAATLTADIPAYVAIPQGKRLKYTGSEQQGVVCSDGCSVTSGTAKATEVGDYFAGVKLKSGQGYRWADGTWDAKFVSWSISNEGSEDPGDTPEGYAFGSAGTRLVPGTYTVPVSARKAANHDELSAAATAFHSTASLAIADDGTASIVTEIESVQVASIEGHASSFEVYQRVTEDGRLDNAGGREPVSVLRNRTVTPTGTGPAEVPQLITFQIPNAAWDGVYMNMYVDAMGYSPDLWLSIDYANAVEPGAAVVFSGKSRVMQFGEYDVNAKVSVADDVITGIEIEGSGFAGSEAEANKAKLAQAITGMKDKWNGMWIGHGHSNAEKLYYAGDTQQLDTVSGATYSCKAIRDAVMNALEISYDEENIAVPASVKPGIYEVPVSYYTDIVLHQLAGTAKASAKLTVGKDGSMRIDIDLANGTAREPLYVLGVNGYYVGNDTSGALESAGLKTTRGIVSFSDEYFAAGTPVVTHVSVPLVGGLAKEYATQVRLYVPVMNKLSGQIKGITFDHGTFDGDAFIKVHWNDLKAVSGGAAQPAPAASVSARNKTPKVVKGKTYKVAGHAYKVTKVPGAKTAGAVTFTKAKNAKAVTVPAAVTLPDGKKYNVTAVGSKAFTGKKIRAVTVGAKVAKLAKGAFKSSKATKLVLKTKKLKKAKVKGCLKGSKIKAVKVKVGSSKANKKYKKKYKKLFVKAVAGKKVRVA